MGALDGIELDILQVVLPTLQFALLPFAAALFVVALVMEDRARRGTARRRSAVRRWLERPAGQRRARFAAHRAWRAERRQPRRHRVTWRAEAAARFAVDLTAAREWRARYIAEPVSSPIAGVWVGVAA